MAFDLVPANSEAELGNYPTAGRLANIIDLLRYIAGLPANQQTPAGGVVPGLTAQGSGAVVEVDNAVVTAAQYAAGKEVGPIITFANILPASFNGVLESITLKFKASVQNTQFVVCLFNTSPPNGTYADDTTPTWNSGDSQFFIGAYALTANQSPLGTHSIYNLDGIGKQIVGKSTSLFAVVISTAQMANALASIADMQLALGTIW